MANAYSSSRIDDLPSLWDGMCKLVRSGLGVTAFGVNVLDIGPDYVTTDHTESESGQEELYVVLRGSATMLVGPPGQEERVELAPGEVVARVAPEARRLFQTGSEGARLLIVGGTPGKPYERQDWSSGGE
jgi:mannose-6-phosphate isomerase-like protein (cupin superfamily)